MGGGGGRGGADGMIKIKQQRSKYTDPCGTPDTTEVSVDDSP